VPLLLNSEEALPNCLGLPDPPLPLDLSLDLDLDFDLDLEYLAEPFDFLRGCRLSLERATFFTWLVGASPSEGLLWIGETLSNRLTKELGAEVFAPAV